MPKKNEWLDVSLINSPFKYSLCTSESMFQRELKRLGMPPDDWISNSHSSATAHIFNGNDTIGPWVIVCIRDARNKDPIVVAGLLVHEAVHIWQQIRENIGETNPSAEFEAYSVQWISQQLMWEYKRQVYG